MKWIFLAITLVATPAFADVELYYAPPRSDNPTTRLYVHDGRVRLAGNHYSTVLYNATEHRFLILDAADKTYRVVDRQVVADLRRDIAHARQLAQALPSSLRDMIRNHAPGLSALIEHPLPIVTLAATGATVSVGEYRCRTITINVNDGIGYGLCVTPADKLEIPEDEAQTLVAMATDLRRFGAGNLTLKPKAVTLLLKQAGIPVKYADFRRGQTLILKAVKKDKISDKLMHVPPDYRQRPLIDIFG